MEESTAGVIGMSPNPVVAGSTLRLELPKEASTARTFELVDAAGRVVASLPLLSNAAVDVPASVLPGTYVLRTIDRSALRPVTLVVTR